MPDLPVAPGEILAGKYRIERVLGEGGHGVVVAAQHLALGERVAIKVLRPEVAQDQETVARFLREARASVRIKGEHVTRVLDVGSLPNGMPYMVMEYLEGADLATILETKGWLPVSLAVDYVLQTCEALAEAHALGIVHRDIKPSNLFLTTRPDGSPCIKVLDFGISKATNATGAAEMNLTQTQSVLGSPQYMAPEQMRSSKRVDGRTDIWAIGTTLHELLTGRPPFEAQTMPELFAMILQDPAPRLSERRPDMPPALETAVARCLEKDPEKRFADVGELARALAPLGSSTGGAAVERIGRVAFNAARSTERLLPIDGGSAPGVDLSRSERLDQTEKAESPFAKRRSPFVVAAAVSFVTIVGGAAVIAGISLLRAPDASAPPTAGTAVTTAEAPPPPADPLPPPPVSATSVPTPPPATTPDPAPPDPAPPASSAPPVTSVTKRSDPRPKVNPVASAAPPPSASTAPPPSPSPSPSPTPTQPPRAPGIASSRYD